MQIWGRDVCYFNFYSAHRDSLGRPFASHWRAGFGQAALICWLDACQHLVDTFRGRGLALSATCGKVRIREEQAASNSTTAAAFAFVGLASYSCIRVSGER